MSTAPLKGNGSQPPQPVTVSNFARAESDLYFSRFAADGGFGRLFHHRAMTPINEQDVVRMNRDTLYSFGVFDLDAAPVTVTLPEPGQRFMSLQVVNEDHYTHETVYAPGAYTVTRDQIGTRYVCFIVRTLANPEDPDDLKGANALQDAIRIKQARTGTLELPNWDEATQTKARDALLALGSLGGIEPSFGARDEVEPVSFLINTAMGWGGNPKYAAVYVGGFPAANDGRTVHRLTVKDVPVDGFWSLSVYNAEGYFEKNERGVYSVNNLTADTNPDGSVTVQFGGCEDDTPNCIPITPGWNYVVRLYRPRAEVLDGTWAFPAPEPLSA